MSEWIEIKEGCRMPQLGEWVIVMTTTIVTVARWNTGKTISKQSAWKISIGSQQHVVPREFVTHWMPLPAPPTAAAPKEISHTFSHSSDAIQ